MSDPEPSLTREQLDAACEIVVRVIEARREQERRMGRKPLSQDALKSAAELGSPAPISALLNRRPSGRPGEKSLAAIVRVLGLTWAEVSAQAAAMVALRTERPLSFPDGQLPGFCGHIDPQSFLLEWMFNIQNHRPGLEIRRRRTLSTEELTEFPFPNTTLDDVLNAPFQLFDRRAAEDLLIDARKAQSTTPKLSFFYVSRMRAQDTIQPRIQEEVGQPRLLHLHDWQFKMSPNFALFACVPAAELPAEGVSDDPGQSVLAALLAHGQDPDHALALVRRLLADKTFLLPQASSATQNLRALLRHLGPTAAPDAEVPTLAVDNVPTCLALMARGKTTADVVVVGHAPHYWAVRSLLRMGQADRDLRILLTEEDLLGRDPDPKIKWERTDCPALPADHEVTQALNWDWCRDSFIVVCRDDIRDLTPAALTVAGRFVRVVSWQLKHIWKESEANRQQRQEIVHQMAQGYHRRGGSQIADPELELFIQDGMNIYPGPARFDGAQAEFVPLPVAAAGASR